MSMDLDFLGRLKKVSAPMSASLNALFEAVANAFDATESMGVKGQIVVRILRKSESTILRDVDPVFVHHGYEIEDNGIGFTNQNLAYFKKSDTTNKPSGKGVGRLLWLHVFTRAEIESVYQEDGHFWSRSFTFSEQHYGVNDVETSPKKIDGECSQKTTVRLLKPKKNRDKYLTSKVGVLANLLLEHFLPYFTAIGGQTLTVIDAITGETKVVNDVYREVIDDRHKEEKFTIRGHEFTLHHLMIKPVVSKRNSINLCAANRVVRTDCVTDFVPEVSKSSSVTADKSLRYHSYITGQYLNDIADDERTRLKFPLCNDPQDDDEDESPPNLLSDVTVETSDLAEQDGVTEKELFAQAAALIRSRLREHIDGVKKKKETLLERFAMTDQPQFRPYLERAKGNLDRLNARATKRDIELALYEAKIDGREEMADIVQKIIAGSESHQMIEEARRALIIQLSLESNKANVSALVEYVASRGAVLSVLRTLQHKDGDADKDNAYESTVHNVFFPRFNTSDTISCGSTTGPLRDLAHLWLLDERLVFHRLLSSDVPPSKLRGFLSDSGDPPDLLVFDPAFSTTDDAGNLGSIAIVEFKRPGRNDYGPALKSDPIQQVIKYAGQIRKGSMEDLNGAKKAVPHSVRLHAYIVADVTDTLKERIETYGFKMMWDQQGYYWQHEPTNMLIEIIPWDKLITDAQRRNEVFFRTLGVPVSR